MAIRKISVIRCCVIMPHASFVCQAVFKAHHDSISCTNFHRGLFARTCRCNCNYMYMQLHLHVRANSPLCCFVLSGLPCLASRRHCPAAETLFSGIDLMINQQISYHKPVVLCKNVQLSNILCRVLHLTWQEVVSLRRKRVNPLIYIICTHVDIPLQPCCYSQS